MTEANIGFPAALASAKQTNWALQGSDLIFITENVELSKSNLEEKKLKNSIRETLRFLKG